MLGEVTDHHGVCGVPDERDAACVADDGGWVWTCVVDVREKFLCMVEEFSGAKGEI